MGGANDASTTLSTAAYGRLRRATTTHREELVVRLAGEAGLRPAEITRVRPGDVTAREHDGVEHYFLRVRGDGGDVARDAYLPADVEHDVRQYAQTADAERDDPLVAVSPRRVQMLVADVGERAADRTGDDSLREVSTRSLRQYFARRLLSEEGVDPRAVAAAGGWAGLASLDPFVEDPSQGDVAAAFAETSLAPASVRADAERSAESGSRFDAAFDRVRAVGDALADASTRDDVERRTCEALVDGDAYAVAWVARQSGDALDVHRAAGVTADAVDVTADGAVETAVASGSTRTTDDVRADAAFADWRDFAEDAGVRGAAVAPLHDGETTYGALGVGVDAVGVGRRERDLLADLGRRVGRAVTLAQQRERMLADTVVELAFETTGDASLFARAAAELDCTFELDGLVPGDDQSLVYFLRLSGASADAVLSWAADQPAVADGRLVRDYGDEFLVEVRVTGADLAMALTERGATVREMTATPDEQRVVGDVATSTDVRGFATAVADAFPGTELVAKRKRGQPTETPAAFRESLHESLTDKQAAVLRAAFHAGYFEWPRGSTAEELADAIGITSPTLHNHLRRAQQKLLSAFFADQGAGRGGPEWPED